MFKLNMTLFCSDVLAIEVKQNHPNLQLSYSDADGLNEQSSFAKC